MEKLKEMISLPLDELKEDFDQFLQASLSSVCKCYDHTKGLYPDDCSCETREEVSEIVHNLVGLHKDLLRKYNIR